MWRHIFFTLFTVVAFATVALVRSKESSIPLLFVSEPVFFPLQEIWHCAAHTHSFCTHACTVCFCFLTRCALHTCLQMSRSASHRLSPIAYFILFCTRQAQTSSNIATLSSYLTGSTSYTLNANFVYPSGATSSYVYLKSSESWFETSSCFIYRNTTQMGSCSSGGAPTQTVCEISSYTTATHTISCTGIQIPQATSQAMTVELNSGTAVTHTISVPLAHAVQSSYTFTTTVANYLLNEPNTISFTFTLLDAFLANQYIRFDFDKRFPFTTKTSSDCEVSIGGTAAQFQSLAMDPAGAVNIYAATNIAVLSTILFACKVTPNTTVSTTVVPASVVFPPNYNVPYPVNKLPIDINSYSVSSAISGYTPDTRHALTLSFYSRVATAANTAFYVNFNGQVTPVLNAFTGDFVVAPISPATTVDVGFATTRTVSNATLAITLKQAFPAGQLVSFTAQVYHTGAFAKELGAFNFTRPSYPAIITSVTPLAYGALTYTSSYAPVIESTTYALSDIGNFTITIQPLQRYAQYAAWTVTLLKSLKFNSAYPCTLSPALAGTTMTFTPITGNVTGLAAMPTVMKINFDAVLTGSYDVFTPVELSCGFYTPASEVETSPATISFEWAAGNNEIVSASVAPFPVPITAHETSVISGGFLVNSPVYIGLVYKIRRRLYIGDAVTITFASGITVQGCESEVELVADNKFIFVMPFDYIPIE